MPLFTNSRYFKIQESTLIDAPGATLIDASGATFNHGHGAQSGMKYYDYYQINVQCLNFTGLDMLRDNSIPATAHDSYETQSYKSSCLKGTRMQHIDDITAWTTCINQSQQHCLLWMWGPAGVGKSAIAKSCAEKTAEKGRLGTSFFFSRTQHVDDPKWFFTTIAHQLVQKVDEYRQVVGLRI